MNTNFACAVLAASLSCANLFAQSIQSTNVDGGSVVTELSTGNKVNDKSSLRRSWYVLNDPSCPLQLNQSGIKTKYGEYMYSGPKFWYIQTGTAKVTKKIMAVEVRYILFDVFGEHLKTLCSVEVADIEPTDAHELADRWSASHSDVSHFLSSVAFVAELRTSDGKIWRYNQKAINDELTRVQLKASDTDLNRKKEKE